MGGERSTTASAGRSTVSDGRSRHPYAAAMIEAAVAAGIAPHRGSQRRAPGGRRLVPGDPARRAPRSTAVAYLRPRSRAATSTC